MSSPKISQDKVWSFTIKVKNFVSFYTILKYSAYGFTLIFATSSSGLKSLIHLYLRELSLNFDMPYRAKAREYWNRIPFTERPVCIPGFIVEAMVYDVGESHKI
jgi:hypothetical protein